MHPRFFLSAACLLLTACAASPASPTFAPDTSNAPAAPQATPTPVSPAQAGSLATDQARVAATQGALAATAAALAARVAEATAQVQATRDTLAFRATATAQAVDAARAQDAATATAQALASYARQTAAAETVQATIWAGELQATAQARALAATAQAGQTAAAARRAESEATAFTLMTLALGILCVGLALAAVVMAWYGARTLIDFTRLHNSVVETRAGTMVLVVAGDGSFEPRIMRRPSELPPAHTPNADDDEEQWATSVPEAQVIPYRVNGKPADPMLLTPTPDPAAERERLLCLRLLRAAMQLVGPQATRLPGYRDIGWASDTWTRAVRALKPHVTTRSGRLGGTILTGQYKTLIELYEAVGTRAILPRSGGAATP